MKNSGKELIIKKIDELIDTVKKEKTYIRYKEIVTKAVVGKGKTSSVTDRAVKDGDMTVIDFEGFVDGVAFEGGKGENYPLTIGSGA